MCFGHCARLGTTGSEVPCLDDVINTLRMTGSDVPAMWFEGDQLFLGKAIDRSGNARGSPGIQRTSILKTQDHPPILSAGFHGTSVQQIKSAENAEATRLSKAHRCCCLYLLPLPPCALLHLNSYTEKQSCFGSICIILTGMIYAGDGKCR